jgi:pimeloyl-ACP methyl ester carboxylesterase
VRPVTSAGTGWATPADRRSSFCTAPPFSSYVWRAVARSLARHRQVFVWDMPGYGASEKAAGQDVSLAAQGRVFSELLSHWGLAEPLVVAHDFGGAVALRAHLLHDARYRALSDPREVQARPHAARHALSPHRPKALVAPLRGPSSGTPRARTERRGNAPALPRRRSALVDPVALAPWGSPFFRLVGEHADVFERLPPALHRALVREYVASASSPGLHPAVLDRLVEPWLDDLGQAAFYRQIAQADQRYTDEIQGRYAEIGMPTLVCWGEDDTWIPVAKGRELAAVLPSARWEPIAGAGHLVQEDAPAELTAALISFLQHLL